MPARTLIGTKVEAKAAKILLRVAKRNKTTISKYAAGVLEQHASLVALTLKRRKANGKG